MDGSINSVWVTQSDIEDAVNKLRVQIMSGEIDLTSSKSAAASSDND